MDYSAHDIVVLGKIINYEGRHEAYRLGIICMGDSKPKWRIKRISKSEISNPIKLKPDTVDYFLNYHPLTREVEDELHDISKRLAMINFTHFYNESTGVL